MVTLKRAKRAIPEQTNIVRNRVSNGKRRPKAKAAKAGAAPNESWRVQEREKRTVSKERC